MRRRSRKGGVGAGVVVVLGAGVWGMVGGFVCVGFLGRYRKRLLGRYWKRQELESGFEQRGALGG